MPPDRKIFFERVKPQMVGRQRRSDARLDDRVAFHHTAFASAEPRPIERMRHRADQTRGSAPRQARVRIKRDDVANTGKICRDDAANGHKCGARRAAQKLVQFMQLPALALPPHPFAFALVPNTLAMKEEKAFAAAGGWTIVACSAARSRRPRAPADRRRPAGFRWAHPSNPRAARSADLRPDSPGSELPAARLAPRFPLRWSAAWARRRSFANLPGCLGAIPAAAAFAAQANPSLRG